MFKIVRKYIFENEYVEDNVQEALVKLIRNIDTIKQLERCKLEAYIVYTVKHTAFNHNNKMKRDKRYLVFDEDEQLLRRLHTGNRYLDDELVKNENIIQVREIVARLPEDDQDILIRKYYFKEDDRTIADAHHLMADSVRMRLTRIRRRLKSMMDEEGITYEIT